MPDTPGVIQRYGIALGRLWIRWPYFDPHDLWIGVYAKEPFYEGGVRRRVFYICIVPTIVLLVEWSEREPHDA
jgi:hypothetical protein